MEPGGELWVESSPSLVASVAEQQPPEQTWRETEENLPESLESQASLSQKKKKRTRKNKKNRNTSDSELQDSLTASSSSALSSLAYSLSPEVADADNPANGSQNQDAQSTKPDIESTDDGENQIKSNSTLDADHQRSSENIKDTDQIFGDNHGSSININHQEQDNKEGARAEHAGNITTGEKMEEDTSKTESEIGEQTTYNKKQSKTNSAGSAQPLGSISNTQTLSGDVVPLVSKRAAENISSDNHLKVESSENKEIQRSTENQTQGIKKSLPESELGQNCKTRVEQETKQQRSASVSKKAKLEMTKEERACEKEETTAPVEVSERKLQANRKDEKQQAATATPVEASQKEGKDAAVGDQKNLQANRKDEKQQAATATPVEASQKEGKGAAVGDQKNLQENRKDEKQQAATATPVEASQKEGKGAAVGDQKNLQANRKDEKQQAATATPVEASQKEGKGAAVGDQKNLQENQKNKKQQTNCDVNVVTRSQCNDGEGVTVYFHAILSKDFNLDPEKHKVFIRAGHISGYCNWEDNVCELTCTRYLDQHGHLIEGCVTISKDNIDKWIPYKYFIVRGNKKGEYEFIYKHCPKGVHVDRCLHIQSKYLSGNDWHQYDDIVCVKSESMWRSFKSHIPGFRSIEEDNVKGKQIAAKVILDSLFSVLKPWNPANVKNFVLQLQQFYIVNRKPMVYETEPKEWKALQFGENQVKELILDYLRKVAHPFLNQNSPHDPSWNMSVQNKLGLALIILLSGDVCDIRSSKDDLAQICCLLCLEKPLAVVSNEVNCIKEAFSGIPRLVQCLILFCNECVEEQVHQWLWTIPVVHVITACTDFECFQANTQLESEERWARLEGLPFVEYREKHKFNEKVLQLMKTKKHLVEGNRMLFRSWFSLLPLKALGEFITDFPAVQLDCLLGSFHRLKNVEINYLNREEVEKLLDTVLHVVCEKQNDKLQLDVWDFSVKICLRLQNICCGVQMVECYKIPATSAAVVSRILGFAPLEVARENTMKNTMMTTIFQKLCEITRAWFRRVLQKPLLNRTASVVSFALQEELAAWDHFLKINFPIENFTEKWKETLISDLEGRIKQEDPVHQIKVYCCLHEKIEHHHNLISKVFENCAIEAVNVACQTQRNLLELISSYDLKKLGKLVSAVIMKSWPTDETGKPTDDLEDVLNHLLVSPDIKHLFTFNGADGNILDQLTDEAKELMTIADSIHTRISDELTMGYILVKHLELVAKHKKQFLSIWELKDKHLSLMEKRDHKLKREKVLNLRFQEILSVKREQKWLGSLLDMCKKVQDLVKVDIAEIEQKHKEKLAFKALHEVVNMRPISHSDEKVESYYHLSPALKKISEIVDRFKESHVFQYCWEKAATNLVDNREDLINEEDIDILHFDEVPHCLFEPCDIEFRRLYNSLKSGEITFAEVDTLFKDFMNNYEELKKELLIVCGLQYPDGGEWIDERVQQIQQYHELHLAVDAAKAIDKVREGLNLSGNFKVLLPFLNFIDESFQQAKLSCMSPELVRAKKLLQGINEPRRRCLEELVLRKDFVNWVKEALEDINELKVFVDLASISAGENDMDVDRVACFHDAVLGYSSLFYELKQESGFEEFMKRLEKLWKALESDPNLAKKLRDSARYLQWLKTIKESHGSVELSSISLATAINSKGIYRIGAPAEGQKVSLDTVLSLTLPESHDDQEEERQYSLEELRELMNKLMLMSGKVEQSEEVEKFSEVFSSVQRLAKSFIDLYSAGNMLFRSSIAGVHCPPRNEFCISMEFQLNHLWVLYGNGELTEVLPAICKKMESFLERWERFMSEKRSRYFYLNYYTAEQLVYLCRELGSECPSEAALMMLSFIKHNCSKQDIQQVSKEAVTKKPKRNIGDQFKLMETERELTVQLEHIWESYMESMSSFLPGCLDIETLGIYLGHLAALEKRSTVRRLPQGLHTGRPNLILCPRSEVLASALAIYMNSPEETLPSYDEVLLCTPQTSYEQVALFLRRCLTPGCQGEKIYTLLYADELSYDVGYRSEELFQRLDSMHQDDYRLVILCNGEREHCYVPSVFSQFKVHMIPQQPLKDIQSYLGHHFRATQLASTSAAVFKDQMCVGIVSSKRAGVGKSLYVKRVHEKMEAKLCGCRVPLKTIRLIDPHVDEGKVLKYLIPYLDPRYQKRPIIFHFDITSSVQSGIPEFLFKLFVLQYLSDIDGKLWLRKQCHLYVVEILEASLSPRTKTRAISPGLKYNFLDMFPKITCRSPKEVLEMDTQRNPSQDLSDPGMDQEAFYNEAFQRPFQYLRRSNRNENLDTFNYEEGSVEGTPEECLQLFLIYCGVIDPSWSELRNFAWFLNLQLRNCETSVFCNAAFVQDTLQGFKNFVVTFMILMAKDFATPSLNISDESPGRQSFDMEGVTEEDLLPFRIRKKWESEPHPYIFFNEDSVSMTFIGFHLQPHPNGSIDAINPLNGNVIKSNVMTTQLYQGLLLQRVPFNVNFDALPRHEKIEKLCMVLGIQWPIDPDETYELTTDNILKILAIEMRFRCGIPVVLMGETGCGKTRLIKFLCELRRSGASAENMKLIKVHGGTTADTIYAKVREAEGLATENKQHYQFDTILFFDEANTTEAVSSIKEVLCDRTVDGQPLICDSGLQIIAACNPYRKHTERMIERLESSGLGYRVKAEETTDKLGSIPLRQLVYRVHALPGSMIPLVWDFGQLNNFTEKLYIQQIVQRLTRSIRMSDANLKTITEVLFESQTYMRQRNDECSFISLRDVERCVEVFKWFYSHNELLMTHMEKYLAEKETAKGYIRRDRVIWSLVLSVGVCYHASLESKKEYRKTISEILPAPYDNEKGILEEIGLIQDLFLSGTPLRERIARNLALKENVFMMVICIELKIPLFLIGKPGSSKSLAKTIVADAMQGQAAHSELYKELKQIHLVSFQCSPHSTPEGIISTFKHCARFQEGKNLKEYVSVVVLDEIGLAEDSPKMPLKTLHPLLEDGCVDDIPLPHKKVGFIGISNWALDPAKMNRGIFVSRGDPNKKELLESAKGICSSAPFILQKVKHFFPIFANAYDKICKGKGKEFFGLRDYYSLIKMIFTLTKKSKREPSPREIAEVVLRNFSGKEGVEALDIFMSKIPEKADVENISTTDLIQQNIYSDCQDGECRYLLVLTENYAALQILQQTFFKGTQQPEIIFGSSFPRDQEYTQICRNINRVKICMETGKMVVLLNLQNLYESLYDALNQYYVHLADQKYVDLGLGTHRVKCRVHPKFRLIVIEEKEVVYKQFPIPLINRLEKHYLDINTVLDKRQKDIVKELEEWVKSFTAVDSEKQFMGQQEYTPSDVFVGYHSDTCASVVLQVTEKLKREYSPEELMPKVQEQAKLVLLNCATPDSVVRLGNSRLGSFLADDLARVYFQQQQHTSLPDFLHAFLCTEPKGRTVFIEITTFSRLLTAADIESLEAEVRGQIESLKVLFLQQFDTEHSFLKKIRNFLDATLGKKILIIQTDFENGSLSAQLVASAKYSAVNEINKIDLSEAMVLVFFITKLSRVEGGSSYVGFQGGIWQSVHIDDLRKSKDMVSDITTLRDITISQLFSEDMRMAAENFEAAMGGVKEEEEVMEVERSTAPEPETLATQIMDTTVLLRSCVQSAVGMLRDQKEGASRSMKRIEILLSLLSEEDQLKDSFLKITKNRLLYLLRKQEENSYTMNQWVLREASNLNALQEAGTFRHTLWKRVQSVVTPFLAHMVSVLDRDHNLELLVRPSTKRCVKDLWMFIFNDLKLLNIPYVVGQSSHQNETILVQNYFEVSTDYGNEMPFSWRIKDYLEDLSVQAHYTTDNEGHAKKFIDIFQKTPLGQYIADLCEEGKKQLFQCYVRDFILLAMGVSSHRELELLQMALMTCIEETMAASSSAEEEDVPPLPWIHLGYHQFRSRLQNFSRILAVCPDVVDDLTKHIEKGSNILHRQMILDVLAAQACTEMLEAKLLKCRTQTWLQQVKNLQMPVELVCTANYLQSNISQCNQLLQEVRNQWNRIFAVSLFMEHVLLGAETLILEVRDLVKKYTMQLGNCFQWGSDIKTHRTFTAVMKVLCECKENVSLAVCRYGLKPCPICLGDPKDPVNLLPCDHVYCQKCIKQWLVPGQMFCPLCLTNLPDDYTLAISEELSIAIENNAQFRRFCNSFFVELVSTMCFKDNEPPEKAVIQELLKLLFVPKELLKLLFVPKERGDYNMHTKSLSPFDDVVDRTPVIRSVVLKLLLKYSFNDVKVYLQEYLSCVEASWVLDKEDKIELYTLFVNCLEDSMSGVSSEEIKTARLREDGRFLTDYLQWSSQEISREPTIEYLQGVACIRLCIDRVAELIFELHGTSDGSKEKDKQLHLQRVMQFCCQSRNNWYKVYLLRRLTNQYGLEFTQRLSSEHQYHWMFPEEIIQQQQRHQPGQIDRFLVCGKNYREVRDAMGKAMIECQMKGVAATLKTYNGNKSAQAAHFLLAVFRELTSLYGFSDPTMYPKQKQCDVLKEFIQKSQVLPSAELKAFAESLMANSLPSLTVSPRGSSHMKIVVEMAVHTAAILLCRQNRILEPLRNLAFSPNTMQRAFLPTMPEDLLSQAANWLAPSKLHWYTCPNGHPCTVGECGRPLQLSRCVDCGAAVGGENYRAVPNFVKTQPTVDRTQTGHVLGDPGKREAVIASERAMSPAVLILIRLLTHLALLLGATKDPQSLLQIIKTQIPDPVSFLMQHIHKDLEQLMNTLGKSIDETTNVVHLILCSLLKDQHANQWPVRFDGQLSTKQNRNHWEEIVANTIIVPELKLLDKTLLELNQRISEDERICSNPVVKIIYGDPVTFLSELPLNSTVHCSRMWSCRKKISVEYLGHVVQQKGGKDAVPILWKFLQKEAELRLVKFLPEILTLQKELVKRFQNISEVDHRTVGDFLNSLPSESIKSLMENRVKIFMSVWNKLRRSLETNGEIKLPQGYCDDELTLKSEFEILLPRRRGLGLCSTALASYLISLHNDFVYTIEKYTKETNRYSVSPAEVADLHMISYEVERDLIPLILSNCQYSVEKGGEALEEFDLEKIQQQITSRFLQGKPLITLKGIPTLVYRHDRNYEHLFNDIKSKLNQSSLPNSTISMISGELQSYSDICEALTVTEITLGFLAMAGGDSEMTLAEYVENILQMGSQTSAHMLKALSRCHLKHTIALWQLLSSHKSEQLLHLKRDPFAEVSTIYKEELTAETTKLLNAFLMQAGLETFLQELHEMIILKLRHTKPGEEFNPTWSLKETLIPYLDRKGSDVPGELEDAFPEKVPLSQCIAVWKAAAALKHDRRLG
ncbi:E3 ubiquitin-protein ligase RNF213-like isoform X2 [Hemicordylus capensis]|nr:E3 ubiquitin-protein ligase RNF213-like isoform X2 [Hemicordylus capensis]XP_053146868.1 E3 ubiquitin-protein ligase RNF213-like isoform X2 [Hemicordylus capensis]XP_053146870.1 E3 ubiquitin-protein ligase RNF213-like isoform X2 [Hemicordylus capensis]XP_053146871.1 E3 ubiquitin-protein ligase RNF213-like isoform X2 [Hemicordylus capensis]